MVLEPGQSLAHYHIVEKIGEGGMGVVWKALDSTLDREVALKVLPDALSVAPDRLARFEREAKLLASLNHPNIVTIHSVESFGGIHFLTMELLEGKTLAKLIDRSGLPLGRFLDLAIPLADALAAAHAKGVTHRDLKPSNIMVDPSGWVKVLDFGLARPGGGKGDVEGGSSALPTKALEEPLTGEGKVVGTTAYMSPEQAEGRGVDQRSDIFSLGIVLYEMTTGVRPFKGDTPLSTISSILRDTPRAITDLNRALPRDLGRIIMRCLSKDAERRFQTALDVRNELEDLKREMDSGGLARAETLSPARKQWTWSRRLGVAGLVVLIAAGAAMLARWRGWFADGGSPRPPAVHLTQLTQRPGLEYQPTISPDGRMVAFVGEVAGGKTDIFLQRADGEKAINLTADSSVDDTEPSFSPDGSRIAFHSEREGGGLFVMGATGESPRRITDFGHYPSWSPDGTGLLFSLERVDGPRMGPSKSQIWTVKVDSGQTRLLLDVQAAHPVWSPGGRRIAYWAVEGGRRDIWTMLPDGTDLQAVTHDDPTDWRPLWAPDGRFLYFVSDRGGTDNLWRIPVSETSGRPLGSPEAVTTGTSQVGTFSMSRDGRRLAASVTTFRGRLEELEFDSATVSIVGAPRVILPSIAVTPVLSPDGRWVVYASLGGQEDVFLVKTDGTGLRQLTDDPYRDRAPTWSASGDRIAFFSNRSGKYEIWTIRPDGGGLRRETETPKGLLAPAWSPDGSRISCTDLEGGNYIFQVRNEEAGPRVMEDMEPLPPFTEEGRRFAAFTWSPDGSRLAGDVLTSSGDSVGLALYSLETGGYTTITRYKPEATIGYPVWLPDGRRLLYTRGESLLLLDSRSGEERLVTTPKVEKGEKVFYSVGWDGRSILGTRVIVVQDIWLIDVQP